MLEEVCPHGEALAEVPTAQNARERGSGGFLVGRAFRHADYLGAHLCEKTLRENREGDVMGCAMDDLRSSAALAVAPPQSLIGASAFRSRAAAVLSSSLCASAARRLRRWVAAMCRSWAVSAQHGGGGSGGPVNFGRAAVTRTGRDRAGWTAALGEIAVAHVNLDAVGQPEETRGCIRCGSLIFRRRHVVEACRVVLRDVLV
jgi:hypothetical protein